MRTPSRFRGIVAVGLIMAIVSAATAKYGGGSGTAQAPYLIRTAEQMNAIGVNPGDWSKHFKLMADIDLSAFDCEDGRPAFNLIGPDTNLATWYYDPDAIPFTGVFDGNGHAISHLKVTGISYLGLFCYLEGAEVRDLGVVDVDIAGADSYVGGLAGYNLGSLVTRCYSTGTVVAGQVHVGGLIGYNRGRLTESYSTATVLGDWLVGGLTGDNWGTVTNCYSVGAVSAMSTWASQKAGGLIPGNWGTVTDCFWDVQTSGQTASAGGTGKTTPEMQTAATFINAGWDFLNETTNGTEDIWMMRAVAGYPILSWQRAETTVPNSVEDFETGDFQSFPWQHGGDAYWNVVSARAFSGQYSARAGEIGDDQASTLSLTLDCVQGNIQFGVSVSSEESYDKLIFLIDGVQMQEWSGEQPWTQAAISVAPGVHTFEWSYQKDPSSSHQSDTAWLDSIIFPLYGSTTAGNPPGLPQTGSIISGVSRAAGESDNRPPIGSFDGYTSVLPTQAGGLRDGNFCFSDRTYSWIGTPAQLVGAEYVRTFNTDKKSTTATYAVAIRREATVMITADYRIFDRQTAVDQATARFAPARTFRDTGLDLFIREDASTNRPMRVYSATLPAGTYVFGPMTSAHNFYTIAAMD